MAILLPSPFVTDPDRRFELDEAAFVAALAPPPSFKADLRQLGELAEAPPAFIAAPSQAYLRATEIMPIVETLGDYLKPRRFAQG